MSSQQGNVCDIWDVIFANLNELKTLGPGTLKLIEESVR